MESRPSSPITLLAVLMVLLVPASAPLVTRAMRAGSQEQAATESPRTSISVADSSRVDPSVRTARQLIDEYLGVPLTSLPPSRRPQVRVLVASVPDPIDSHLDWGYDAALGSIRRAYEVSRSVSDRFWLPWTVDATALRERKPPKFLRREHPGVMVFRAGGERTDSTPDVLHLVFLVGETPTSGIHKGAFAGALGQIAELRGEKNTSPSLVAAAEREKIRIVGPYFTGAATSMRNALEPWRAAHPRDVIEIVTGSATQPSLKQTFEQTPGTRFQATVNSDDDLLDALVKVLRDRLRFRAEDVVILREASTEYGQKSLDLGDSATSAVLKEVSRDAQMNAAMAELSAYTVVPFPMNIATLREEAELNARVASDQPAPAPGRRAPFTISLRENSSPAERPPSHSGLTAATVSLLVDEIARTLSERNIRAVGIIATDVRDKIFLAREVRNRVPDVQLFTTESNLLYLWPEYNETLRGMLVATSYPLVLDDDQWSDAVTRRGGLLAFQDEAAEGIFNATLLQLGEYAYLRDYALPGSFAKTTQPPVWVVSVGRRGFFPIRADANPMLGKYYVQSASADDDSLPATKGAMPARPSAAPRQAGSAIAMIEFDSLRALTMVAFVLGTILLATYVLFDSWRGLGEHIALSRFTRYRELSLADLRSEIHRRSLLLHLQLYSMLRSMALGSVVLVGAVLLMRDTHEGSLESLSLAAMWVPLFLALVTILLVLWSARWMFRVLRRTAGATGEYLIWRDWKTGERRDVARWFDRRRERVIVMVERRLGLRPSGAVVHEDEPADVVRPACAPSTWDADDRPAARHLLWGLDFAGRFSVFVVALGFSGLVLFFLYHGLTLDPLTAKYYFHRASQLGSGVSPALPVIVIALGFAVWCNWHLARIQLLKKPIPFELLCDLNEPLSGLLDTLRKPVRRVRERLFHMVPDGAGVVVLTILVLLGFALFVQFDRSLESIVLPSNFMGITAFDLILRFGVLSSLGALAWALYRLWIVWTSLEHFLDELETSPMLPAFERVPRRLAQLSRLTMRRMLTREGVIAVATTQWGHLQRIHDGAEDEFKKLPSPAQSAITELMSDDAPSPKEGPFGGSRGIARLRTLFRAIQECWMVEPMTPQILSSVERAKSPSADTYDVSTSGQLRRLVNDPARLWLRAAEETAVVQIVAYIEWVLRHLRILAFFIIVSLVLVTVLLNGYPFQPQSAIRLLFIILLAGSVISLLFVGTQMNRNDVLSRITRSDPGRITWDAGYIFNLILFGVVPVLTFIGSDVRPIREGLLSWLEPLMRAITQH